MLMIDNQTNHPLPTEKLETMAAVLSPRDVELLIVDSETMQALNHTHRGKDGVTDVLSFPLEIDGLEALPLGSVVICAEVAQSVADSLQHSFGDELCVLFLHGLLHLLGYDHEDPQDNGLMRAEEERWLREFQLPSVLTTR